MLKVATLARPPCFPLSLPILYSLTTSDFAPTLAPFAFVWASLGSITSLPRILLPPSPLLLSCESPWTLFYCHLSPISPPSDPRPGSSTEEHHRERHLPRICADRLGQKSDQGHSQNTRHPGVGCHQWRAPCRPAHKAGEGTRWC